MTRTRRAGFAFVVLLCAGCGAVPCRLADRVPGEPLHVGDLVIDGGDPSVAACADLADLGGLVEVDGALILEETHFTSLDGLDSLQKVDGPLIIRGNDELSDIRALAHLTSVGQPASNDRLIVQSNRRLPS